MAGTRPGPQLGKNMKIRVQVPNGPNDTEMVQERRTFAFDKTGFDD